MSRPTDRAATRLPPPLVFLVVFFASVGLERYVVSVPTPSGSWVRPLAMLLAIVGTGLLGMALATLVRSGQDPAPWTTTPSIVRRGVYRVSRNPMYVGLALIQASFGLSKGYGWAVLLVPVSLLWVYWISVRHEETYLEKKFGEDYLTYKESVRRWL